MEEWKEYKIGDICSHVCSGGTPSSKHAEYYDGDIPWLNTKEINFNRIYNTEKCITEEGLNNSSAKWIAENSVIVAMYGATAGKTAIAKIPLTTNQACCNLTINPNIADYRFVYYFLYYKFIELASLANGGAQQNLNAQIIKDFDIVLPSLKEQTHIANLLSSLEDKIEVNRRINDNLEQQAQALFKSWFVDFEPFKDGEFVESELGMIPKGWKVGTIGELCSLESGYAFQSCTYVDKGLYRLVTIKNVQDGYLNSDGAVCLNEVPSRMPTHCLLKIGDILLSLTGNVGRCCLVNEKGGLLNQRVAKINPKMDSFWGYVYTFFRNEDIKALLISIARGTAQANLSPVETLKHPTIVPTIETIEKFSKIVNILYEAFINNMIESRRLAELRDTLLPRLMSGELDVNNVAL